MEFLETGAGVTGPAVPTSYEVLRMTLANEVLRQNPAWSVALAGIPGRSKGWSDREMIKVRKERVNR